jgi:hypothetical protein
MNEYEFPNGPCANIVIECFVFRNSRVCFVFRNSQVCSENQCIHRRPECDPHRHLAPIQHNSTPYGHLAHIQRTLVHLILKFSAIQIFPNFKLRPAPHASPPMLRRRFSQVLNYDQLPTRPHPCIFNKHVGRITQKNTQIPVAIVMVMISCNSTGFRKG